ncbi:Hypothetical protein NTJ_05926 [Nesidiocoris tenuis]|uniref:Uncharacterized protein n=1 Tax=Nesidiocoris tenuis TaxID=355587 RepID=A0ABN7ALJ9_9HEMI|nr:Hypothetical protein NTJ_05926 [Nesidiocoris tenuis]
MFGLTFLAVALQVAAVWGCGCECPGPILGPSDSCLGGPLVSEGVYPAGDCGPLGAISGSFGGPIGGPYIGGSDCNCAPSCVRHRLEPVVRPVVDECISHVPVVKKNIRHQEECYTRHVPVVDRVVTQQQEKIVRHVPVTQTNLRNVVECRTRHVPIVKSRTRTVVEPYTTHVPITEKYTRPVEESVTRHVPIVERRCRPIVQTNTRLVPVTERRLRPIVESCIQNVPVKRRIVKNVVEQRVRPVVGPCNCCNDELAGGALGGYPVGLGGSCGLGSLPDLSAYAGLPADAGCGYPGPSSELLPGPDCGDLAPLPSPCGC